MSPLIQTHPFHTASRSSSDGCPNTTDLPKNPAWLDMEFSGMIKPIDVSCTTAATLLVSGRRVSTQQRRMACKVSMPNHKVWFRDEFLTWQRHKYKVGTLERTENM